MQCSAVVVNVSVCGCDMVKHAVAINHRSIISGTWCNVSLLSACWLLVRMGNYGWMAKIMKNARVPPTKTMVTTIAKMRSSTAAASIQSCFISFSLASSHNCSILLWSGFSNWCISCNMSVFFRRLDGDERVLLLTGPPLEELWLLLTGESSSDGVVGFRRRYDANFLHKRFFICNVGKNIYRQRRY